MNKEIIEQIYNKIITNFAGVIEIAYQNKYDNIKTTLEPIRNKFAKSGSNNIRNNTDGFINSFVNLALLDIHIIATINQEKWMPWNESFIAFAKRNIDCNLSINSINECLNKTEKLELKPLLIEFKERSIEDKQKIKKWLNF